MTKSTRAAAKKTIANANYTPADLVGECVEIAGGRRLPRHPLGGLLMWALRTDRNGLFEILRKYPEDFYQEAANFLLSWHQPEGEQENWMFVATARKHFRNFARQMGWYTPHRGGWKPRETPKEEGDGRVRGPRAVNRKRALVSERGDGSAAMTEESRTAWFRESLLIARKALDALTWRGFRAYVGGANLDEIARLTGWAVNEVEVRIVEAITRVRAEAEVDAAAPIPEMPERAQVQRSRFSNPWPRTYVAAPVTDLKEQKLTEIRDAEGVSRATAWRVRNRGWFFDGHWKRKRARGETQPWELSTSQLKRLVRARRRELGLPLLESYRPSEADKRINAQLRAEILDERRRAAGTTKA